EMNQLRILIAANFGEKLRRVGIDRERFVAFRFRKIDICKGGRIDQNVELKRRKFFLNLFTLRKIELRVTKASYVELSLVFTEQRSAKTTARAQNHDAHFSVTAGALKERLPPRLIIDVPLDRRLEAFFETFARFPFQFLFRKRRIDRVATVVTEPIGDERNQALRFA